MPLDKNVAKVYIQGMGEASLADMEKVFLDALKEEDAAAGRSVGYPKDFPPETQAKLDKFHQDSIAMVEDLMQEYVNTELLVGTLEGTVEHAYVNYNPINEENSGGFGTFLEQSLFGTAGDNRPTADIDTYKGQILEMGKRIEVKAKTGSIDVDAGDITVYGLPEAVNEIELKAIHNITLIYKMMIKMRNFLYLNMRKKSVNGHPVLGFYVMTLYTSLYLRALYALITYERSTISGAAYIDVKQPKQPSKKEQAAGKPKKPRREDKPMYDPSTATYSIPYEVAITFHKSGIILKGLENIARLYLRHSNLIDEISTGGITAAALFKRLRKIDTFLEMD